MKKMTTTMMMVILMMMMLKAFSICLLVSADLLNECGTKGKTSLTETSSIPGCSQLHEPVNPSPGSGTKTFVMPATRIPLLYSFLY